MKNLLFIALIATGCKTLYSAEAAAAAGTDLLGNTTARLLLSIEGPSDKPIMSASKKNVIELGFLVPPAKKKQGDSHWQSPQDFNPELQRCTISDFQEAATAFIAQQVAQKAAADRKTITRLELDVAAYRAGSSRLGQFRDEWHKTESALREKQTELQERLAEAIACNREQASKFASLFVQHEDLKLALDESNAQLTETTTALRTKEQEVVVARSALAAAMAQATNISFLQEQRRRLTTLSTGLMAAKEKTEVAQSVLAAEMAQVTNAQPPVAPINTARASRVVLFGPSVQRTLKRYCTVICLTAFLTTIICKYW